MARIPDEELTRLKQAISLVRLLEAQGVALKKAGTDYLARCPFHDDREPSLVISPKKNLFHCFGCGAAGTVIDWVMKTEGVSFRHAAELLRERYQPSAGAAPIRQSTVPKLAGDLPLEADDRKLLNRVVDYYHQQLKQDQEALAYLRKRGLNHPELIATFKLGVSNRTLGYRLPKKNRKAGKALRGQLQRLGVYRESGHEHFAGSLIVPVLDEHGDVQQLYGRKLRDDLRKGTAYHLYLPGAHRGVFNVQALEASKEMILCESLIDALTFWVHGYRNVTASYGVNGFTDRHLAAFKDHAIERVLIAYDGDRAGNEAAEQLAERLTGEGIDCYRIVFPLDQDANGYAGQCVSDPARLLGRLIRSARWLGKGEAKPVTTESVNTVEDTPARQRFTKQLETVAEDMKALETPADPLPATPMPEPPQPPEVEADVKAHELVFTFANRRYRVRGLDNNHSFNVLKINLLVSDDNAVHVDTFDLYQARPRAAFIKQAAVELGVKDETIKADLGKLLLKLEALQEEKIKQAQTPDNPAVELNDEETQAALELLKSPDLLNRLLHDIQRCGLVGEDNNALVGYLASVSRKLDHPLAVIIQSTSAAGKSSLMDAVLAMMPEEERVQFSAMTGQSLFYLGETDLKHKILAIAEEEGAQHASYALKLLQSEGELTIASTGKDESSGDLVTKQYRVEGPVMLFLTTTAIDIDEELMNRCLVLTVNESREQTQAIHALQRKRRTLDGLKLKQQKQAVLTLHRNAQRLLKPLHVINPYADRLTFTDTQTRTRRDHEKYLTLIDAIALLHQYQRPTGTLPPEDGGEAMEYIEVTLADIEIANRLAHDVLGRTLDELPPQTRALLRLIDQMVSAGCAEQGMNRSDYRFSRRQLRDYTRWGNTQLGVHLDRLVQMEYLLVHRGGRGRSFVYELLYDGQGDEQPHLSGLIDVGELKNTAMTATERGQPPERTGTKRPRNGANTGAKRDAQNRRCDAKNNDLAASSDPTADNTLLRRSGNNGSYRHPVNEAG